LGITEGLPRRNTIIWEILEIPAVTRNSGVLRSGNSTSGQPYPLLFSSFLNILMAPSYYHNTPRQLGTKWGILRGNQSRAKEAHGLLPLCSFLLVLLLDLLISPTACSPRTHFPPPSPRPYLRWKIRGKASSGLRPATDLEWLCWRAAARSAITWVSIPRFFAARRGWRGHCGGHCSARYALRCSALCVRCF
jgi:hypothetical protein